MKLEWTYTQERIFGRPFWFGELLCINSFMHEIQFLDYQTGKFISKVVSSDNEVVVREPLSANWVIGAEKKGIPLFKFNPREAVPKVIPIDTELIRVDWLLPTKDHKGCYITGQAEDNSRHLIKLDEDASPLWTIKLCPYKRYDGHFFWGNDLIWFCRNPKLQAINPQTGETVIEHVLQERERFSRPKFHLNKIWLDFNLRKTLIINTMNGTVEKEVPVQQSGGLHMTPYSDEAVLLNNVWTLFPYYPETDHIPFKIDFRGEHHIPHVENSMHAPALRVGDVIYVGNHNCYLWAFDANTGALVDKWLFDDFVHNIYLAPNGFLIVEVMDGNWHAFSDYPR